MPDGHETIQPRVAAPAAHPGYAAKNRDTLKECDMEAQIVRPRWGRVFSLYTYPACCIRLLRIRRSMLGWTVAYPSPRLSEPCTTAANQRTLLLPGSESLSVGNGPRSGRIPEPRMLQISAHSCYRVPSFCLLETGPARDGFRSHVCCKSAQTLATRFRVSVCCKPVLLGKDSQATPSSGRQRSLALT